ncbi:transposase [Streptomyces sp. NPDC020883]|uniref:transposase n=1 Tax=Streptomyces sp. NPDC020883 TaxID=3365099 RepID=UPI0037B95EEE
MIRKRVLGAPSCRDLVEPLIRANGRVGKSPHAVAAVIDSQSVRVATTVPKANSGYDAGKKVPGRKRHIIVDTRGLQLFVMVTPASVHDSAAAREALFQLRLMHPEVTVAWADLAYAGTLVDWAKTFLGLTIKTVSRPKGAQGFVILPADEWSRGRSRGCCTPAGTPGTTRPCHSVPRRCLPSLPSP